MSVLVVFGVPFPQCRDVDEHNNTDKYKIKTHRRNGKILNVASAM